LLDEVARQPVERLRTPGLAIHFIRRIDESAAEEPLPDAIHQGARQAPVSRIGEDGRNRRMAVRQRTGDRSPCELWKQESGLGELAGRGVAAE